MAKEENDSTNKSLEGREAQPEPIYEDEINLMDYFVVLWKRKWFIFLVSVLPALVAGSIIFFGPRNYKTTYTYDVRGQFRNQTVVDVGNCNLTEGNYNVFISRFYSQENLSKITTSLQQADLKRHAESIINTEGKEQIENLVKFEVLPPYIDVSKAKETDPTKLKQIRQLEALLLNVTITANSKKEISKISSVIRDNLENIMPVYLVAEQLKLSAKGFKSKMADIEKNRFALQLALENKKAVLAKLKGIETETLKKSRSDIMLQFDVGGRSEYLPIEYQIQTAESKIIQLEETIKDNEKKFAYYEDLLSLDEKVLAEVQKNRLSGYTIQQFHLFLLESVKAAEKEELKDYLSSYTKKIENRIAVSAPVTENPIISAIAKGTVKKSGAVFVIALLISVFAAFILEGLKKSQAQIS